MRYLRYISAFLMLMGVGFAAQADPIDLDDCEDTRNLRQEDFVNTDPQQIMDCMMRGASPPESAKKDGGMRQGPAASTFYTGVTPPQKPANRRARGGGSSIFDRLLQNLPFQFPPSLPDLFGGGGGGGGGGGVATGVGVASGVGADGLGGTPAEDSFRCEVYGETAEIPKVTGKYAMPCGGAIELADTPFTLDTNVEYIGHIEKYKSILKIYKRQDVKESVDGTLELVGSKYTYLKEVTFPGYYCTGASAYAESVPLIPVDQYFAIGSGTKYLAVHLQPDSNPKQNYDPADPSATSGSLNYDHTKEFIIIQRNGENFTPIGKDCDLKNAVLFGMPSNMGTIAAVPSGEDYCSVQTLPMSGSCSPDVMWLNLDDSNFLYQPDADIQLHDITGVDTVLAESDEYTAFYMQEASSLYIPWGTGEQVHADGTTIIYNDDYYIYISPPGRFEVKNNGKIFLPNGGTLYTADDVETQVYPAGTEVAKGSDFAYRVEPNGAIALPAGVMAIAKPGGTIRLPEDK